MLVNAFFRKMCYNKYKHFITDKGGRKMLNIVHVDINCNDQRRITRVEVKVKSSESGDKLSGHPLVATVSAAFYKTTLLADSGTSLQTALNTKRKNVVDLSVTLKKDNELTFLDVAKFIEALQVALNTTSLF